MGRIKQCWDHSPNWQIELCFEDFCWQAAYICTYGQLYHRKWALSQAVRLLLGFAIGALSYLSADEKLQEKKCQLHLVYIFGDSVMHVTINNRLNRIIILGSGDHTDISKIIFKAVKYNIYIFELHSVGVIMLTWTVNSWLIDSKPSAFWAVLGATRV